MRKRTKAIVSLILAICLLLSVLPSTSPAVAAESSKTSTSTSTEAPTVERENSDATDVTPTLLQEDVSLRGEFEKHFIMSDGSYQVALYNEPVHQLVDGQWVEIDNTLALQTATDGTAMYATANGLTDVRFAQSFDDQLVTMSQGEYKVSWGVQAVSNSLSATKSVRPIQAELVTDDLSVFSAEEQMTMATKSSSTIQYRDALMSDVDLEYIVLPSRVKENIILQSPQDISSYVVTVYTEGLSARLLENRRIEFYDSSNEVIFTMTSPYMYDSVGELSEDIAVEMVSKGSGCYFISMTPNAQWLSDESRVYPVVIDPQVTTDSARTNIIDNYVLEGSGVQNNNLDRLYIGNKSGHTARAYIKFATMPTIPEGATIFRATMSLQLTSGASTAYTANAYKVTGGDWASDTITWANQPAASISLTSNISHNNMTGYTFSCLNAIHAWYNGSPTGQHDNYGIMLRYNDETISDYNAVYSADYSDETKRPSITINYLSLVEKIDVDVGVTRALPATELSGTITWTSSNTSIARVSSGYVTGVKAGETTVTASVNGQVQKTFTVYVTIADGVYYMGSNSGLYLAVDGSLVGSTPLKLLSQRTEGPAKIRQLWKIKYMDDGCYNIRSLYKSDKCIQVRNNTAQILTTTIPDTISSFTLDSRWKIEANSSGYVFQNCGTTTSKQCLRPSGTSAVASTYVSSNPAFTWTLTPDTSVVDQLLLLNSSVGLPANNAVRYIIYGTPYSLSDLNLMGSFVSQTTNNQNIYLEASNTGLVSFSNESTKITGVASGDTTIYVKTRNCSDYATFKLIVIGPNQYSKGVRIATVGGKQYYDYTIPLNNLFLDAVELCGEHRCMNLEEYTASIFPILPTPLGILTMQTDSFLWFLGKVYHGEEWDIKVESSWEYTLPGIRYLGDMGEFVFRGRVETTADVGNIMYGYTGSATGFGETTLYWGGGVAETKDILSEEAKNPPYYGDREEDHEHIAFGIQMFNADYPDYPDIGFDGIPTDENWLEEVASILSGST